MALTLLRHTMPEAHGGLCYGRTDLKLAPSFDAECAALLPRVPAAEVIVTSPLSRCRALAERLSGALSRPVSVDDDWIEMDFGRWEACAWSEIPRNELDDWAADFLNYRGHGGESVADLRDRIGRALARLPQSALVVTHAGCIKAVLALGNQPPGWDARPDFGSLTPIASTARSDVRPGA